MRFMIKVPNVFQTEEVEADYFKIDSGHLIFRCQRASRNEYPATVKAYAPGAWATVEPKP